MMLRVERKYLVPNSKRELIRERLLPFVDVDSYTHKNEHGISEYTVRSIYYDSKDLCCYSEKHEGVMLRRKFRIRGYNEQREDSRVVMEIKRKFAARQKKYRSRVMYKDVEDLLHYGDLGQYVIMNGQDGDPLDDASRFMYHIKKKQFIPTCLVVYEREAYFGKFDKGVRITFDKNIRSRLYPPLSTLYEERDLKLLFRNNFILEIKYFNDEMPLWARSLVQEFRLRNDALSKYTIGIDVNREKVLQTY